MVKCAAVCDSTANNRRAKVPKIEPAYPGGSFVLLVPHGDDENQTWRDACLKHSQEEAQSVKAGEVVAHSMQADEATPQYDMDSEILGDWELLSDVLGREHPDEESHVEGLRYVVVPNTSDGKVHDRCVAQDILVEELGEVHKYEQRHDMEILDAVSFIWCFTFQWERLTIFHRRRLKYFSSKL